MDRSFHLKVSAHAQKGSWTCADLVISRLLRMRAKGDKQALRRKKLSFQEETMMLSSQLK